MAIKHSKVSAKADGADTTVVRPSDWNDDHEWTEAVTATAVADSQTVVLTLTQASDATFAGAPALVLQGGEVSADLLQLKDENGVVRIKVTTGGTAIQVISADESTAVVINGTTGISTGSVTFGTTGGVNSAPTDSGSDGITLRGDDLVAADGGAMIRIINPVGDMPDGFYGTDTAGNLTINADMSNGAAKLLIKGATPDGTIVKHAIPLKTGGWTVQTYAASNVTTDRTYDADATSTAELADVLGTLIADLRAQGIVA